MSMEQHLISLSDIDEERFGIRTAKASDIRAQDIPDVIRFCTEHTVELLIARCPTSDLQVVQKIEQLGFLLMDTLIYFSYDLMTKPIKSDTSFNMIRMVRPGEEDAVRSVALGIFQGYQGHYHADIRLDRNKCDAVYSDWAYRSCVSPDVADAVLVAETDGKVIGFGTIRINSPVEGEGMLFGVTPLFQGKCIYRSIMMGCLNWCAERGLVRMIISTQITNLASQKVWIRLGFEPIRSYYTFHKWFS
jgi:GNAT superfamily N-acetyltransferase